MVACLLCSAAVYAALWAHPDRRLTALFLSDIGWTGADGAYSVAVSDDRVLWFFGDTFIDPICYGRRTGLRMVHNTCAVQTRRGMTFHRKTFAPSDGGYYWPGAACMVDDHLYLFVKHVVDAPGPPGFDFKWVGSRIEDVANPQDAPAAWRVIERDAPGLVGTAAVYHGGWLYAYGLEGQDVVLARSRGEGWTWWTGHGWGARPAPLFGGGATEMSVSRVPGRSGWYAVYSRTWLSPDIVCRRAPTLTGPWGPETLLYRCPERGVFTYAAKAHPEQTRQPGHLVVTYCCNLPELAQHLSRPSVYRPRVVDVRLP